MFEHSLIGAITFLNESKGEQSWRLVRLVAALVSRKIDLSLNAQAFFDPVFKCYLNELKINLPNKSYSRDNRLNKLFKLTFSECFGTSMSAYVNQNL